MATQKENELRKELAHKNKEIAGLERKLADLKKIMEKMAWQIGSAPLLAISQLIRGEVAVWYATILSRKLIEDILLRLQICQISQNLEKPQILHAFDLTVDTIEFDVQFCF
ncbi:hypothetical protein HUJ05_004346 [Dendroctonus ponderosae]|nr:hypothetical protein HUJ05_004346 [Dendroctonus ponderosae]